MSIRINAEKCKNCGQCINVCPGSLIEQKDNVAYIRYPKDCWGCASCLKACRFSAIDFFLGADIGGRGSTLHAAYDGDFLRWEIHRYDGENIQIDVNAKNANSY